MDLSSPNFQIQDGDQQSKGVELEIVANPVIGWTILLGYGYNNSKLRKAMQMWKVSRPVASGPEHTANFWTNYTFTKTALKGLGLGISLNYAGGIQRLQPTS